MSESLQTYKRVSADLLQARIETVKTLREDETEYYEIVKDRTNGEHYLLYTYVHLVIADGHRETYYHLMPLASDDVLGLLFGEQEYRYPDSWTRPYLRNSAEDDGYVWFDPAYAEHYDAYEQTGRKLQDALREFKQNGSLDEEAVRRLLEKLDGLD